jgi:maleate isomerase
VRAVAGFDIPVALASDAVIEALKRHGIRKNIAVLEPYYPSIEARMQGVLAPHGYQIIRFNHLRGKSPASYSILTARDMIEAIKAVDGPDVEAIVQFGANLPMARLADEAERWLDKPVISVNVATYWHACRMNGIDDKRYGFTQLFARF